MNRESSPRRSSSLRRIGLCLAALAIGYGLIEGAVYLAYEPLTGEAYGAGFTPEGGPEAPDVRIGREQAGLGMRDASMSLHPYFGYVYTPRASDAAPSPIAISPDGFLDDRPAVRRRDGSRLLVGITGGSVAGQLGTWHSELLRRAILAGSGGEVGAVELVRLGMPGYHQPQQLQQLTYLLAQGGELDVLLNLDGFNEVAVPATLNAPRGTHPLYPMNWSMVALDVPDLAVRRDIGALDYLQEQRRGRAEELADSWVSRSPLRRLWWKLEDRSLVRAIAARSARLQAFQVDDVPYFVRGPQEYRDFPGGLIPFCVDVWRRSSLQMHALCQANGIRYVHLLQPNQYFPDSKPLSEEERTSAFEADSPYRAVVEEGYPLLRAAGQQLLEAGVEFVDLAGLFADVDETLYVDNCCHFNALGNEILSAAIADVLADPLRAPPSGAGAGGMQAR